jgi:hypothetical protein
LVNGSLVFREHYLFECNCPLCLEQVLTQEALTSDESESGSEEEEELDGDDSDPDHTMDL